MEGDNRGIDDRPDSLIDYHVRAVRVGVLTTYLVVPLLALYPFTAAGRDADRGLYFGLLVVAILGAASVHALPWRHLFETGLGDWLRYAWSVLDIVLITAVIELTGGPASPMFGVYALTTVFFAASYPWRGQLALLCFTFAAYAVTVPGSGMAAGELLIRLGVLGVLAFLGSFLSRELLGQIAAHAGARDEADRRAALLGAVAGAGTHLSVLEPENVLTAVVDSVTRLGFEAADLCLIDDAGVTYEVVRWRGLPDEYTGRRHAADTGMVARVLAGRCTVVSDFAAVPDGDPDLRRAGFRAVVATPVWVRGRLSAVLEGGTRHRVAAAPGEVEALELLAFQAGRAIENAQRFEDERAMVGRLADLDRLKNDFVSNVSHELRTPLTVVLGMAATLAGRWDAMTEDTRERLVARIEVNARRLESIVSSLLDFSRLEAGEVPLDVQRLDASAVVRSAADRLSPLFADRSLLVEVEPGLPVLADLELLERVLENLLGNAAKHTPPGTAVTVSVRSEGPAVVVEVADEGPGNRPDELAHLGERFFRGGETNTRETGGLGLGLAIVRQALDRHGSKLEIESVPGRGSRFRFRLPLAHAPVETSPEA